MNVIATTTSKLGILSLVAIASLTTACTSNVLGTGGDPGPLDPSRSGSGDASGSATGSEETGSASGVPADIEALFAPPETDAATPGSVFGLWASSDRTSSSDDRVRITKSDLTVARRCTFDGRIAYVTAKIRVSADVITILESKSASLPSIANPTKGTCGFTAKLDVQQWRMCDPSDDYDYACIRVDGTTLRGLTLPSRYSTDDWIKLSD